MVRTQVFASCGPVSLLCLAGLGMILAAPTTSSTSLAIREASPVAEYFDQADLIKRVNLGLFSLVLTTFGTIANTACTVDVEPTSKTIICGIAIGGAAIALLAGTFRALQPNNNGKRDLDIRGIDPKTPQALISHFPHGGPGLSPTVQMLANFSAGDGAPILAAYHDCYEPGCFNLFYQNRNTKGGKNVHHISPRTADASNKFKRQDNQESANEGTGTGSLWADYLYHDENINDEIAEGNDGGIIDHIENDMNGNDEWSQTGIHCFDLVDNDDGGARSTGGYMSLNNDTPYQDPDNEDSYISQCENAS
ncbi:hypothetical protein BKA64DRAFT_649474 [Cadophora sp. MPI-SDFR-AT-0126]|nr:hypothetical protein BKA64DRAFT_649474 [Leotiomycetes sp. MPI-SDFR-AT-0126]